MSEGPLLLLVGDHPDRATIEKTIRGRGYVPQVATSLSAAAASQAKAAADVVVLLLPFADHRGTEVLSTLRAHGGEGTIIVVGRDPEIGGAPDALDFGATEYVADAVANPAELLSVIGVRLSLRKSDAMLRLLRRRDHAGAERGALRGECAAMQEMLARVDRVCRRSLPTAAPPVLITGETGTGKSLLAKYIHYNGARRNEAFVDINCATIPRTLVESELFGHERGAFTDARFERVGLFEAADRGTLFLDEIGALPLDLQPKLLSAIEDQKIRRIGSRDHRRVDVQVIAATLNDLESMIVEGTFREDLYHRLSVVRLRLPALRERGDDIFDLAETFIAQICRRYGLPRRDLTDRARTLLRSYRWPGNVRELQNELERIILLEDGDTIDEAHFHQRSDISPAPGSPTPIEGLRVTLPPGGVPLEQIERHVLGEALNRCEGNVSAAARFLSISRQTMIYRLRKHGLS